MDQIQPTTYNLKAFPCQEIEEVNELEGEEEEPIVDHSEEEMEEEDDHLNSPTEELPGLGGAVFQASGGDGGKSLKKAGAPDLRSAYWDFIHDAQKKLKKEHPDLGGKEILKRAREQILGCI